MTEYEKNQITVLQCKGYGYKHIASTLNLPLNSVKTYCRRHPINKENTQAPSPVCLQCGTPIVQIPNRKAKKFCSDRCRIQWWNSHQDQVNRKAYRKFTCPICGKTFTAYGKRDRIYCSRTCYASARRKEISTDE